MNAKAKSNRLPRPTEDQVAAACLDVLKYSGYRVERLQADQYDVKCPSCDASVRATPRATVKQTEAGTPDYIAIHVDPMCFFYLEVKRPKGKLRKTQELWIDDARNRGWPVCDLSGAAYPVEALVYWLMEWKMPLRNNFRKALA